MQKFVRFPVNVLMCPLENSCDFHGRLLYRYTISQWLPENAVIRLWLIARETIPEIGCQYGIRTVIMPPGSFKQPGTVPYSLIIVFVCCGEGRTVTDC